MDIYDDIPVFGGIEDAEPTGTDDINFFDRSPVFQQIKACVDAVPGAKGTLMADKHLGYRMPIGGVVAYPGWISPTGVGYDIGCGNIAMMTRLQKNSLPDRQWLASEIRRRIKFGIGTVSDIGKGKLDILDINWSNELMKPLQQLAATQLGTVGGGNHYVDLLVDDNDTVWIACHFGSRGFGHKIAKQVNEHLGLKDVMMGEPGLLKEGTALFDTYLEAMQSAGDYASLGRQLVMETVLNILDTTPVQIVENYHNFAWKELVDDQWMWVIRKGATPIYGLGPVFIGGSMAGVSVIAQGNDVQAVPEALGSAPHGSGRIMSRGNAKRTIKREDMDARLVEDDVILSGGDVDESPFVYRDLMDVIANHAMYITPMHWLQPILVVMAGKKEVDPYRD